MNIQYPVIAPRPDHLPQSLFDLRQQKILSQLQIPREQTRFPVNRNRKFISIVNIRRRTAEVKILQYIY